MIKQYYFGIFLHKLHFITKGFGNEIIAEQRLLIEKICI